MVRIGGSVCSTAVLNAESAVRAFVLFGAGTQTKTYLYLKTATKMFL